MSLPPGPDDADAAAVSKLSARRQADGALPVQQGAGASRGNLDRAVSRRRGLQAAERATADAQGYFYFLTPGTGSFQIVWDDGGTVVKDPETTIAGNYVSDTLPVDPPDKTRPQVTLDLYWEPRPVPVPDGTFDGTFKFKRIPDLDAEYFIQIFDAQRLGLFETEPTTGEERPWDRKNKDGEPVAPGPYYYKIKFKKPGKLWGAFDYFGSTQFIPFKVP